MRPSFDATKVGNWAGALAMLGVPESVLRGKCKPCPMCGGTDRFTFDDRRGRGDWVCRKCNDGGSMAGDGISLLMRMHQWSFTQAVEAVTGAKVAVPAPVAQVKSVAKKDKNVWQRERLIALWNSALPLTGNDPASAYLKRRIPGLQVDWEQCLSLRYALSLPYFMKGRKTPLGHFPALLAKFVRNEGACTVHVIYLDPKKSAKATIIDQKTGEVMPSKRSEGKARPLRGGAVRLSRAAEVMGVAEGIETAMSCYAMHGLPVWACLSKDLLRQVELPSWVREVHVFVDFDKVDQTTGKSPGILAANQLASRLRKQGVIVKLHLPSEQGTDFNDEYLALLEKNQRAMLKAA